MLSQPPTSRRSMQPVYRFASITHTPVGVMARWSRFHFVFGMCPRGVECHTSLDEWPGGGVGIAGERPEPDSETQSRSDAPDPGDASFDY